MFWAMIKTKENIQKLVKNDISIFMEDSHTFIESNKISSRKKKKKTSPKPC